MDKFEINEMLSQNYKDFDTKILGTLKELRSLASEGFSLTPPFNIDDFEKKITQGQILFFIFKDKKLAHSSCIVSSGNIEIYPPMCIDYSKTAYIWYSITAPEYRGMGLYPYALYRMFEFLRENGKTIAILAIQKGNIASLRAVNKANLEMLMEARLYCLFGWTYFRN